MKEPLRRAQARASEPLNHSAALAKTSGMRRVFDREKGFADWVVVVLLGGVFAGLSAWSWRKWPDTLVDYGTALYLPWQLASGKVLCRDMTNLAGGPLSQYFHLLIFRLFGVSFTALLVANLVLVALLIWMLYRLFLRASDQWTATMICLVTLCVFAFSQYVVSGNYNYICPYADEAFHGLLLSVVALGCLSRWLADGRGSHVFAAGLCFSGVFLTKPDLFVALAAALIVAGLIDWIRPLNRSASRPAACGLFVLGAVLPLAAFVAYFTSVWNFSGGLKAIAGSWVALMTTPVALNPFYQFFLGLDQPGANLWLMIRRFGAFLLALGGVALFARALARRKVAASVGFGLVVLMTGFCACSQVRWVECGSALGPIALAGVAFVGWKWWINRGSAEGEALIFPLLWAVFAFALLAKMGLKPRIWHYGFYLGMPAGLLAVFLLLNLLPRAMKQFQVNSVAFRVTATVLLLTGMMQLLRASNEFYRAKDAVVGEGADRMMAYSGGTYEPGPALQRAIGLIRSNTPPSSTLAVLPEGLMINYLTRRPNPTPYEGVNPTEMLAYGETNVLEAYARHSPDYILLVHRDTSEWKAGYFGAEPGYGHEMMQWIRANYSPVWLLGHEPFQTNLFGIKLLGRNDNYK